MRKFVIFSIAVCLLLACSSDGREALSLKNEAAQGSDIEVNVETYLWKHRNSLRITVTTKVFNSTDYSICIPAYYSDDDLDYVYTTNRDGYYKRSGEINFFSDVPWDNYIIVPSKAMKSVKHNSNVAFSYRDLPLELNFDVVAVDCQSILNNGSPSFDELVFLPKDGNEHTAVIERFEFREISLDLDKL